MSGIHSVNSYCMKGFFQQKNKRFEIYNIPNAIGPQNICVITAVARYSSLPCSKTLSAKGPKFAVLHWHCVWNIFNRVVTWTHNQSICRSHLFYISSTAHGFPMIFLQFVQFWVCCCCCCCCSCCCCCCFVVLISKI